MAFGSRRRFVLAHVALATGLVLLAVLATFDAWRDVAHIALRDEEQSQILLVPLVAGWLFWIRRGRLRRYEPTATWIGPLVVALGWALNWWGDRHLVQSLWHFGAILVATGALLTVAGGGFLTRLLPVFASLVFLVPVPGRVRQAVAIPLQAATARITQSALETLGVAVERSGNMLHINHRDVMVADACNGLRMVFALAIVSYVCAYGVPLREWVRALVVVVSPLTAIVFNVVRLVPTVWAAGSLSTDAARVLHDAGGWVMLPCAFLTLLGLMRLLRWAQIPVSPYILAYGS